MPIGIFDSGYGGLSILKALQQALPHQSFIYLGDHANAPYGSRSKDDLYKLTVAHCDWLFRQGCDLVILACNTASSVVRRIQHEWLPTQDSAKRVLGIVVPTIEGITGLPWRVDAKEQNHNSSGTVGVFATDATVRSEIYPLEIHKRAPNMRVMQQACTDLVTLIESGATEERIRSAVKKYAELLLAQCEDTAPDYVLLGCTHYMLIEKYFREAFDPSVTIISQPDRVAESLRDYLDRHPHFRSVDQTPDLRLFTTGDTGRINTIGASFLDPDWRFESIASCLKSVTTT